ncbi:ELMO/CED-12 domain containing 2 [Aphelenchoides avenae]|nr:ELMO/CED-12 domain containing 2 [Aphelenchus avenae]
MPGIMAVLSKIGYAVRVVLIEALVLISKLFSSKPNLERIMSSSRSASSKTFQVEHILKNNSAEKLRELDWESGAETEEADALLDEVEDGDLRLDLSKRVALSMRQIRGYQRLCEEVETRRRKTYDTSNDEHEKLLMRLWTLMKPEEQLEKRRTTQWQSIGFQGDDPATDFRGMGILGLDQLVFFAQYDVDNCKRVLSISLHPRIGFPYAICGITITALAKELLLDGMLKNHFYNTVREPPTMTNFHQIYCRIFVLFAEYWEHRNPETIMDFNPVKQQFVESIEEYLRHPEANLLNITLEDVLV